MIVTFGEIMLRISPVDTSERIGGADRFLVEPGGSESNVAVALANLGNHVSFITKIPDNPLGQKVLRYLRNFNVDTSLIQMGGERIGIYWTENGIGVRASEVIYDRKDSAFSMLRFKEIEKTLSRLPVKWFHVSGITPAVSEETFKLLLRVLNALSPETKISVDLNYRAKLWDWISGKSKGTIARLMKKVCEKAFLITANETDFQEALGYKANAGDETDRCRQMAQRAFGEFKVLRHVAISNRRSVSASENQWSGMLFCTAKNKMKEFSSMRYTITPIVDRVGTGDSFTAGIIHGLLHYGGRYQHTVDFAVALSALNHTTRGDASQFSEKEVEHMMKTFGNGRILR